ncbi:hypothetical protein CO613_10865 [Lysobacteraceae bacterium NML07-0707]|nr:hypothetical protein CO613_10865 [Xanthomonadaceae bacterium NML07-0707]
MQLLERIHLVQFFLFEAQTLELDATSAIIAPNGAGKSALLDALQIVLLGGDRSRIRFNAQAGGSHRARSIRDYCLGVFRSGDEGRKRRTATTYISLVFRDTDNDQTLTAGIALGASADEAEHRLHGLYLLPGVALSLDDHIERIKGKELPLAWSTFREMAARRCKQAGSKFEQHNAAERFVKDLLFRLRGSGSATPDVNAYRKAFLNALNLQRVEDVDLFVRTLVAEDRPTDIARFRALLESFRQIRDRIEQVRQRIDAASGVEQQYAKIAAQAVRAASSRALAAEYARDLYSEQIDAAQTQCRQAQIELDSLQRQLEQERSQRDLTREEQQRAQAQLQGSTGYGEQAHFDEISARDRERLQHIRAELLRETAFIRDQLGSLQAFALAPAAEATAAHASLWDNWHAALQALPEHAPLPWSLPQLFDQARDALAAAAPLIEQLGIHVHQLRLAQEKASDRLGSAQQNKKRLASGQSELSADTARLMSYLREEGIDARPVCDLVEVSDKHWQPAIEAYLRSNVEALLIPEEHETRATALYRRLSGARTVYGVKLALASQARRSRGAQPARAGSVAALLTGINQDALAFLRRQLGELRCVQSESELVNSPQALSRDGLLARGGSIERLRLPAASELKIGAHDNRARLRLLQADIQAAESELRELAPKLSLASSKHSALARLTDAEGVAQALHARAHEYQQALQRYRHGEESRAASLNPDLLRLSELVSQLKTRLDAHEKQLETLIGQQAVAERQYQEYQRLLEGLRQQEEHIIRHAVQAFGAADVDPNLVERYRQELDTRVQSLQERRNSCERRAEDSDRQRDKLLPEAWSTLAQYSRDHGLVLDFDSSDWRPAQALLQRELSQLRDTELVRYQDEARQAYDTAVETFRANVAAALNDNFGRLREQINTLNRILRSSPPFSNNERYQFHYEVVPEYKELARFIKRAADVGEEDNLFGSAGEVPAAFRELVEDDVATARHASALDDYRRFFRFEVRIQQDDRVIGTLSERMRSGSGGEHRAPLYVIAGAALAAAYGKSEANPGGIGLILLDEFGDKIDAQNARATTNYLRSLGLQLVLAAPDTAQGTLSGVLESYIELFRDDDLLQAERIEIQPAARELLLSDQFDLHPHLLSEALERIRQQQAAT